MGISKDSESEEDELSMLSRRINQMWKHMQKKFRNCRRSEDIRESSGHKKFNKRDIICYECKEPYISEVIVLSCKEKSQRKSLEERKV